MRLDICHLYPDLLNLYGDRGNILSLTRRCSWRGIEAQVHDISIGDRFDAEKYDIVFLGGGQDLEQEILADDLFNEKASEIKNAINNNKTFLCICGGYQILGAYYIDQKGKQIDFLGAIDIYTESSDMRMIGNTIYSSDLTGNKLLVGFENHSGKTYLGNEVRPLATVVSGFGNNGEDHTEGAIYKNVFCSYSHGPLLPKNPALADHILKTAFEYKYGQRTELPALDDSTEDLAREKVLKMIR